MMETDLTTKQIILGTLVVQHLLYNISWHQILKQLQLLFSYSCIFFFARKILCQEQNNQLSWQVVFSTTATWPRRQVRASLFLDIKSTSTKQNSWGFFDATKPAALQNTYCHRDSRNEKRGGKWEEELQTEHNANALKTNLRSAWKS